MAPTRLLPLSLALLAAFGPGCTDGPDSPGDAGPLTPYAERPFPRLGPADFEVSPEVGFPLAKRHLVMAFREGVAEAEAARVIASTGGTLVGALGAARIVMVQLPASTTTQGRLALITRLEGEASVEGVTEDMILGATIVPQRNPNFAQWDWDAPTQSTGNHALRAMGMPVAWNLNPLVQPVAMERRVRVGVIDGTVQRHRDLVPDILTIQGEATPDNGGGHGTSVAGIIGARWDGLSTDGVSPFVAITAAVAGGADSGWRDVIYYDVEENRPVQYAEGLSQTWQMMRTTRPRVVNISLGFNHYDVCYPNLVFPGGRRCDPRQGSTNWGTPIGDSNCDGAVVRQRIAQSGRIFGAMVNAAQSAGPTLFVVAAGNDSGPNTGEDFCALEKGRRGSVRHGMGLFPAELASPYANAGTAQANPNVVVVEVVTPNEDMRGPVRRTSYSNIGGSILAPGDNVQSLTGGGSASSVHAFNGTSSASPHVAGAAAFLVALNPRLDNRALRALLTAQSGDPVADTPTRARLYVPAAIAAMEVQLPDTARTMVSGARLLADMDDGSGFGLSAEQYDPDGVPTGPSTSQHDPRGAPVIDMRDFRYLRNSALLWRNESTARCPNGVPACDLNHDTRWSYGARAERHPRAEIVQLPLDGANLGLGENLAAFLPHFAAGGLQGWQRDELQGLLQSGDVQVFAGRFLGRAGATAVRLTIEGEPSSADAPTRPAAVTNLPIEATPEVLTLPFRGALRVRVTVVGGMHDGRVFESRRPVTVTPGSQQPMFINPCALEEMEARRRDILDPYTPDCSPSDAGVPDAGVPDAGLPDAGLPDAGVPDAGVPDAGTGSCEELARGTAPYVRFSVTGGSLPASYVGCYGHVPPATFNAYFNSATGRTLFRMTGRETVNGQAEDVNLTFHTPGNAPSGERWPTDIAPTPMRLTFFATPITAGTTLREFTPTEEGGSGSTTVTSYGPVGGMIEGTFNGTGVLWQLQPSVQRFEPATITGSFRVPRSPDP